MIKPIVRDMLFLGQKSTPISQADTEIIRDLQDTLKANHDRCVGMAANMIGYKKRSIIVSMGVMDLIMNNPELVSKSDPYETEEGCLSLDGTRKTIRYKNIEVRYQDLNFKEHTQKFSGFVAQIILHEMDHLEGVII